ncbi:MAG: PilZ domain-containing protein [Marinobacter sp.]|nr:PilZ domain-containing protein [Marinobacter sp.]
MKTVAVKPNLRNQQRVDVSTRVTIERNDGSCLDCKISNLSRTGLMISCSQKLVKELVPGQKAPVPGSWIPVKARFSVPVVATQPVSVIADGNIVHMRRIARDEYQVGIQFAEFEGNGYDYVDRYVSTLLSSSASLS